MCKLISLVEKMGPPASAETFYPNLRLSMQAGLPWERWPCLQTSPYKTGPSQLKQPLAAEHAHDCFLPPLWLQGLTCLVGHLAAPSSHLRPLNSPTIRGLSLANVTLAAQSPAAAVASCGPQAWLYLTILILAVTEQPLLG